MSGFSTKHTFPEFEARGDSDPAMTTVAGTVVPFDTQDVNVAGATAGQ
jgi:hypothetical protein